LNQIVDQDVEPPNLDKKVADEQIDCPDTEEFGSDSNDNEEAKSDKSEKSGNITDQSLMIQEDTQAHYKQFIENSNIITFSNKKVVEGDGPGLFKKAGASFNIQCSLGQ
jgi:hypothetical protein